MKTSDLFGKPLDWAVATCEKYVPVWDGSSEQFFLAGDCAWTFLSEFSPSTNWSQGGPIIERESIWVRESAIASPAIAHLIPLSRKWFSYATQNNKGQAPAPYYGPTYLISAMRCYVASVLDDEVDIPKELL